jgi:hypothetical protein
MPNCTQQSFSFPPLKRRKIEAEFSGGDITSDGGVLLLRQVDKRLGLLAAIDKVLTDPRDQDQIKHSQLSLLSQRVYGLCLGYEDLNDHQQLRQDPALQTAVNRDEVLGSQSTLCRLENRIDRQAMMDIHQVFLDQFIASFRSPPEELILDFDATDDPTHGQQEHTFYHGYYRHYCFLPLYVFCNDQLLVSYLRPSNKDGAKHSGAILKLLVDELRAQWPDVRIIFRADGGFCRRKILSWCERHDVFYIVGYTRNSRLSAMIQQNLKLAEQRCDDTGEKQRDFMDCQYGAKTWRKKRHIIAKLEVTDKGPNPRFIVTNLPGTAQTLYDTVYCARGDMENRIKEQQLGLFADRTSAHEWWANQFRLLLSSLGYILLESIRRLALKGTELEKAQASTIRLKLLKIGAVILRNTRRIRFLLSSHYPYQDLFKSVAVKLQSG